MLCATAELREHPPGLVPVGQIVTLTNRPSLGGPVERDIGQQDQQKRSRKNSLEMLRAEKEDGGRSVRSVRRRAEEEEPGSSRVLKYRNSFVASNIYPS